jgi:hypothetical protein
MTALGLHLARARNDSDYQKSGALLATMRDALRTHAATLPTERPSNDSLRQPPPGGGSANLSRLSGEASHQNRRASPTAGPRTRTVPPCESVEARCQKRVHGAGAICAYEEEVPRSRLLAQERFLTAAIRSSVPSDHHIISLKSAFSDSIGHVATMTWVSVVRRTIGANNGECDVMPDAGACFRGKKVFLVRRKKSPSRATARRIESWQDQ